MSSSASQASPIAANAAVDGSPAAHQGLTWHEVWESLNDAIIVIARDWHVAFVNRVAEQMIGGSVASLVGRNYWEAFPTTRGSELEHVFRRAMHDGKPWDFDHLSVQTERWYHVRVSPNRYGLTVSFNDITARKDAQAAREMTEERFRLAATAPWLTLYEQDANLRYTWLYPTHPQHAHALGRSDPDLFPDGSFDSVIAAKRQVLATGMPLRVEAYVGQGANTQCYDTYICPRRDRRGNIVGIAGSGLNVTDRIRAEAALRENEERLLATYRNAPVGIAEADLEGTIVSANERYAAQLGYTIDEVLGRNYLDLTHPDDQSQSAEEYRQVLAGALQCPTRERRYRHKKGHYIWVTVTRSAVRDHEGNAKFGLAVVEDITERKRASADQQMLYRLVATVNRAGSTDEIYNAALDALCQSQRCQRGAILLLDASDRMVFAAWRGLSDAYRQAVEGHSPWAAHDADPQPVALDDVRTADLDPHIRAAVEAEHIGALAFIPLTFERRLLGKFMVYADEPQAFTTERLQAAETIARQVSFAIARRRAADELESLVRTRTASLQEAIQQMEEFSYTVSHDLRAPIRAMSTYATVILEDYQATLHPEVAEFLRRMLKNAHRLDALVRDTLAYSRVARGEVQLDRVALDEVVAIAVAESSRPDAISVVAPLGGAIGHEPALVQVFTNLFNNAVKFVRRGTEPQVTVRAERSGDRVRVLVADNGIGIPPALQARAFGMFERLHSNAEYEGTGIGLAIVRKAMERMGGSVGVESDGANGSTFWIDLPPAADGE